MSGQHRQTPIYLQSSGQHEITYGVASALFGGTAPLVNALLVQRTGNPSFPLVHRRHGPGGRHRVLLTGETAFRPLDADDGRRRPQATARPGLAAKLSRLLHGFPEGDVLPQAERAADLGLDRRRCWRSSPSSCGSTPTR